MTLDLECFTEPVASVLASYPKLELPLTRSKLPEHPDLDRLAKKRAAHLFPDARDPVCAHSGLLLFLGGWEQSHHVAQDISRAEGSYWHAIAHRIEPDIGNAGYWFRRVGAHPIFAALQDGAASISANHGESGWTTPDPWDPFAFLRLCERAASDEKSESYAQAVEIQSLEWTLLFEWCARPVV